MQQALHLTGKAYDGETFLGHDEPAAIFNSLELAKIVDERDCTIQVCDIQSNKIVVAGYLNGSTKTMEPQHFTGLLNTFHF